MARRRRREGLTEEIGGLPWTLRRPPGWIIALIAIIAAWGLYYLITFSVTETGTFRPGIIRAWLRL